jgi:hypothetical protein
MVSAYDNSRLINITISLNVFFCFVYNILTLKLGCVVEKTKAKKPKFD